MRIYHVASRNDWEQALRSGVYTTSTRGRTLEQEGFLHAARADQLGGVLDRFYAGVEIDTDLLDVTWREDHVGEETFPHVYGPLSTSAVVHVRPVEPGIAARLN
jgi:uncharacterized protein (DUF952 family)